MSKYLVWLVMSMLPFSVSPEETYFESVMSSVVGRAVSPSLDMEENLCIALNFRLGLVCDPPLQQVDLTMPYFLDLVNDVRAKGTLCGNESFPPVPALKWSMDLQEAAMNHVSDMKSAGYFGHTSPVTGFDARVWASEAGYPGYWVQDDLANGYATMEAAVLAWVVDKSDAEKRHCKAIMDPRATDFGGYFESRGKSAAYFGWR